MRARTVSRSHGEESVEAEERPLLEVAGLEVVFRTLAGDLTVVQEIDLVVLEAETVAVVGESGSGKSVTALAIMNLLGNGRISEGSIRFGGRELVGLKPSAYRRLRGRDIGMIFQDPLSALDPLFTIGRQLREALVWGGTPREQVRARSIELLQQVGIADPERRLRAYPHELSGGQRQRLVIAIALACNPRLIVADEPTTALDATVEAQILDLIRSLKKRSGTAMLLITHDMSVVAQMADRVVVMYAGMLVESGPTAEVLAEPHHPYTRALIAAVPSVSTDRNQPMPTIEGNVPSVRAQVSGCRFHPRCPLAMERCASEAPPVRVTPDGRTSRCWLSSDEVAAREPGLVAVAGGER